MTEHSPAILRYIHRMLDERRMEHSFRNRGARTFRDWQDRAREALRTQIGLETIRRDCAGHRPSVELGEPEDLGTYTRTKAFIDTEPDVRVPFWLLTPRNAGPHPLAIHPHGHERAGRDTYVGISSDHTRRTTILDEDRDVAVQSVERGFIAIAPATRGIAEGCIADLSRRHGGSDCRSHFMHCLLAGRTSIGERVWDLERIIDWAVARDDVHRDVVLMMGNSGGGMATTYAAACDTRITVAVPSCSFSSLAGEDGQIHHCDCNAIPGIFKFGELWDVAGLIAPRHLCIVNGRKDALHPTAKVDRAVVRLQEIYDAAGVPGRFEHRYGEGGHRFYKDLMWPFIEKAMTDLKS